MSKTFKEWIGEGEQLYTSLMDEFTNFQKQLVELEQHLAAKKVEVDQIAQLIGKPGVERPLRSHGEFSDAPARNHGHHGQRNSGGDVAVKLL